MPKSREVPPTNPIVTRWTELRIPTSRTIEDKSTSDGQQWALTANYHQPATTPGFAGACYGRVIESPEIVWYITGWDSEEALNSFEQSEKYRQQREQHAIFSTAPLKDHRCDPWIPFWRHLTDNVEFIDAYFPHDISDESRRIASEARGLVYHFAPSGSLPSAYRHRPTRGWLHGTQDFEGQDAVVLRFIHFWKSAESEAGYHSSSMNGEIYKGKAMWHDDLLTTQLKEAGLLGKREFHCRMKEILNFHYKTPEEDPGNDSDEDYEA